MWFYVILTELSKYILVCGSTCLVGCASTRHTLSLLGGGTQLVNSGKGTRIGPRSSAVLVAVYAVDTPYGYRPLDVNSRHRLLTKPLVPCQLTMITKSNWGQYCFRIDVSLFTLLEKAVWELSPSHRSSLCPRQHNAWSPPGEKIDRESLSLHPHELLCRS